MAYGDGIPVISFAAPEFWHLQLPGWDGSIIMDSCGECAKYVNVENSSCRVNPSSDV